MKTGNESDRVICSSPIDVGVLTDYWLGALAGSDEEAVELHLLDCDRCGDRLREVIALAEGLRGLAREGSLRIGRHIRSCARRRSKLRIRSSPGERRVYRRRRQPSDRTPAATLSARRVDLCICDERGIELLRLPDIPVHSGASSVAVQESITFAKAAPTSTFIMRLVTVDNAGGEHLLGEYTFNHTRSLPGPGSW